MKSLAEISSALASRAAKRRYPKMQLAADAGVTHRTLSHVMSGEQDYKVSTLLALADRLGLELLLVPKEARAMFGADPDLLQPGPVARAVLLKDAAGPKQVHQTRILAKASSNAESIGHSGIQSKVQARLAKFRGKVRT